LVITTSEKKGNTIAKGDSDPGAQKDRPTAADGKIIETMWVSSSIFTVTREAVIKEMEVDEKVIEYLRDEILFSNMKRFGNLG
jgi:hypothetical protein